MPRHDNIIANIGNTSTLCSNLGFGEQGAILSRLPKSIFVCPNLDYAYNMKSQLDKLGRACVIVDNFSKPFTLAKFENRDDTTALIRALYEYSTNNAIILSTNRILFTPSINLDLFFSNIIKINKNSTYDIDTITKNLNQIGYTRVESVTAPGEYARRGDILDIFNIVDNNPIRLDFFDDEIEDIYYFDSISYEKKEKTNTTSICPNKLYFLDNNEKINILSSLEKLESGSEIFLELKNMLEIEQNIPIEFLTPFVNKSLIIKNTPIIIANSLEIISQYKIIYNEIIEKIKSIFNNEKIIKKYLNCNFLLNFNDFLLNFNKFLIFFENYDAASSELTKLIPNIQNIDFVSHRLNNYLNNIDLLKNDLTNIKDKKIYLCLSNIDTINAIKKVFTEKNIPFSINKNSKGIILTELDIPYNICFEDEDTWYIGSTNFAHKKLLTSQPTRKVRYLPKAGEYVVHSVHGIGKCEGVVTLVSQGVEKEFFKVTYRGGDTLYVPYESADSLSLYMSEGNVTLNKLGGKEFLSQKLKATKAIEDMSKELLTLYAKRKTSKGYKYPEDDYVYMEFENAFNHEETTDQMQAILDVKKDMISGKVMDRLVCGDVGFGKTEVALRAAFKAIQADKQVAILAPTTVLSMQHYKTAFERMREFGVKVEMLNRFRSPSEQKQILSDLKDGKINIICGTHRLLSSDVSFKDLGLLILDEEQRFGVKAKEKLKELKNNVDVLTLSATPIPRTLSMSLMTIRDISIINTPPQNRLPVKTYVLTYNDDIVLSAIRDELNRGGQTLIIFNNVERIYHFANGIKEKLLDNRAKIDVAHGQMEKTSLENAIKRLYDGETNVFISTTIIENGVDLPKANTLIVIDSDKLGLSQMYQLRGRVGRSDVQAYAYFTYQSDKVLTEDSSNRLQAIAENTDLGSGMKIAMRDLQIRGAGELLGKVQHGHMIKIGYDMYTTLLNTTIKRLTGEKVVENREIKLDIALPTKIPMEFISDEAKRLQIIAKISNISSKDESRLILNEILGEFGKIPTEIYNLASIALLKTLAIKQNIKAITFSKSKLEVVYYPDIDLKSLMNKVNKFSHFKFKNAVDPTIELSTKEFSPKTALNYTLEYFNNQ